MVLKLLALFYIFLFYGRPFLHVCSLEENIIFHFNSWLSFQRLCHLLRGYSTAICSCADAIQTTQKKTK